MACTNALSVFSWAAPDFPGLVYSRPITSTLGGMGGLDMSWAAAITDPPTASRTNTARMDLANIFIVDPPGPLMDVVGSFDRIEAVVVPTDDCCSRTGSVSVEVFRCCCQRSRTIYLSGEDGALILGRLCCCRCAGGGRLPI